MTMRYRSVTTVGNKEKSKWIVIVLLEICGILSSTSNSSSNVSSMFLIFSFFPSVPKDTLNHTRQARQRAMSPRQLSPVASTRRHVAQVEKKKDRKRRRNREAKSHSRTRPCVDPCISTSLFRSPERRSAIPLMSTHAVPRERE